MGRRLAFGAAAAACLLLISYTLLSYSFTGRAPFDDEGYILISLRGWMTGHGLYTDVYSQYGPGFFAVIGGAFRVFGQTFVSFESARVATVVLGLFTACALGYATAKMTKSAAAGLLVAVVVALCAPVGVEAALHPTHLIEALVAVTMVGVVQLAERPESRLWSAVIGVAVGLAVLTKVNVGGLLAVAVIAGMGIGPRATSMRGRLATAAVVPVVAALAVASGDYPTHFVSVLALAALIVIASVRGAANDALPRGGIVIAAGATGLVVAGLALVTGTSFGDLVRGVLVEPSRLADSFTYPLVVGRVTIVALIVVAVIARFVNVDRWPLATGLALVVIGAGAFLAAYELRYGTRGVFHGVNSLVVGASVAWVATRSVGGGANSSRIVLCALGMLMPLQAYPVAGGQIMAGAIAFPVFGTIAIVDGFRVIAATPRLRNLGRLPIATAMTLLVVAAVVFSGWGARRAHHDRETKTLLAIAPGSHILTSEADSLETDAVAHALRQCTTFFSLPGLNSFYFFADKEPPTWQNAGAWETLFDKSRQATVVRDLRGVDGLCFLHNPTIEDVWTRGGPAVVGPLRPYLETFTTEVATLGGYTIYEKPGA